MLDTKAATTVDFNIHLGSHPKHDQRNGAKIAIENVNFWYGPVQALRDINLKIYEHEVTAFIGPSGRRRPDHAYFPQDITHKSLERAR